MTEKYIARSRAVAARILDAEMIIMSATDSTLFTLSEVATVIWQAADGRTPLSQIVRQRVCAEFDVCLDDAYRDAEAFAEDLAGHGILRISDRPILDETSGPRVHL
ncbi:MAG TPA: PqqD family protein [Candidatus Acidoferrum sp.]|nr:PqqD family protein [Candidatus Acidoferrum sp.]